MKVYRTENKLLLNRIEAQQMIAKLDAIMPRDAHSVSGGGYEVRSLYFDSLSDRCYAEKDDGMLWHEKIRARIYGTDDSVIKLESKKKLGEHQTKDSLIIDRSLLEALVRGEYSGLLTLKNPVADYLYGQLSAGMAPKAIIQYQRLSFCLPTNNTRITFDYDIRATESCFDLFQDPLLAHPVFPSDMVIMEVKFNHFLLGYIKSAISSVEKLPNSYSKYQNGRAFYRWLI